MYRQKCRLPCRPPRGLEIEEHAVALLPPQPRVDAVGQLVQRLGPLPVEHLLEVLQQHLRAGEFGPGFFLVEHGAVFVPDAAERVERAGVDHFAQDAGVEQAQVVDGRDAVSQPLDQVQQGLQLVFGEHVVDADLGVRAADAVDAAVALDQADRVPGQVVVDDDAAVLKVLAFGKHVGADKDVDLLARRTPSPAADRGELARLPRSFGMVAAVDAADVRVCRPTSARSGVVRSGADAGSGPCP